MARLLEPIIGKRTGAQDFTAVVLVGHGEHLYPFNEGPNVQSKALLPIANRPVISIVLDWILKAGLNDILLIVPPKDYSSISNHLSENYSSTSFPRINLQLKKYTDGEKDEEGTRREGTARVLKRFRNFIKRDFCLIPCDLIPPSYLDLGSLLDQHRARPDTVLSALFYDAPEAVRDSEERILTTYSGKQLLSITNVDSLDDELDVRTTLIKHTRLLDAHIYICRRTVLDLLATRRPRDLDSMKEQVIPWLVKGSWQKGLSDEWAKILSPPESNPFAPALAQSTSRPLPTEETPTWDCQIIITRPPPAAPVSGRKVAPDPEYLVRANTLAGYWDVHRRLVKNLPKTPPTAQMADSLVDDSSKLGERSSLKKTIVGRHCVIGRGAKLSGCVIWDFCTIDENARLENVILCNNVRIGAGATIKDCEFGPGYEVEQGATLKGERLVVGQDA